MIETIAFSETFRKMLDIYNVLVVKGQDTVGKQINVTCEIQRLLKNNQVRVVAMTTTNGPMRGMEVLDTGAPLSVLIAGIRHQSFSNLPKYSLNNPP